MRPVTRTLTHMHTHTLARTKTDQVPERLAPGVVSGKRSGERSLLSCCLFTSAAAATARCCDGGEAVFYYCGKRVVVVTGGAVLLPQEGAARIMPCSLILLF